MKKFLYSMAAVALMAGATTMFTACGSDNDEPDSPAPSQTVQEAQISLAVYVNQEMADTYDITATTADGEKINFSDIPMQVMFKGELTDMYDLSVIKKAANVPVDAALDMKFTIKDGYTVPEKSNFAMLVEVAGIYFYTDGTYTLAGTKGIEMKNDGVLGSKIEEYTARLNKNYGHITGTFTTNGVDIDTSSAE